MHPTADSSPLLPCLSHFRELDEDLGLTARKILGAMSSQLGWRFAPYQQFPLKLARLVHPKITEGERVELVRSLYHSHPCCLDVDFSLKVRAKYRDEVSFVTAFKSGGLREVLQLWSRVTRTTNMHMERTLAQLRRSVSDAGVAC